MHSSVIMLSSLSSSIFNSSPKRFVDCPDFEAAEELVVEEASDSGTLFADILEKASGGSVAAMSESDSDDDILDFLVSKNFVQSRSQASKNPDTDKSRSRRSIANRNIPGDTSSNGSKNNETQTFNTKTDVKKNISCQKRETCMNKGAINARVHRMKKKIYIDELEGRVDQLESEKNTLSSQLLEKCNKIDQMKNEIHYLKSVIANHTSLTTLLNYIPFSQGMQLGSSLSSLVENKNLDVCHTNTINSSKKRDRDELSDSYDSELSISTEGDDVYIVKRAPKKRASEPPPRSPGVHSATSDASQTTAGVCLHVSSNKVSLEFCASCASNAASALSAVTDGTESDKENANVLKAG